MINAPEKDDDLVTVIRTDQMIVCDESEQDVMEISGVIGWREKKLKRLMTDEDIRRATKAELPLWLDKVFDVVNKDVDDNDRVIRAQRVFDTEVHRQSQGTLLCPGI